MRQIYTYIFTFLVVFSAYLMLCLPFAFSMEMNKYVNPEVYHEKKISFAAFNPTLILSPSDDFGPLRDDGERYERFTVFVDEWAYEGSPEDSRFSIEDIQATITVGAEANDVSDIINCSPTKNLVSNQQIRCSLDKEAFFRDKLLSIIPAEPGISFTLSMRVASTTKTQDLHIIKNTAIIDADSKASINIMNVGSEVNCLLGEDVEAQVRVYHAETIIGDIQWGFIVNGTKTYGSESIECSLISEGDINTGNKIDEYLCTLRVPSLAFEECTEGVYFPVNITAKIENYNTGDEFQAVTARKDLDLKLSVSSVGSVDCQIVSEDGDCVPRKPQRVMSVRVTGNRISNVETFAYKYKIDDENFTTISCEQQSVSDTQQSYTCDIFLPRKVIPENPPDSESYSDSIKINVSFQTRYVNTFGTISDTITVNYKGQYRDNSTDVMTELKEKQKELEEIQKIAKIISDVLKWLNKGNACCGTFDIFKEIKKSGFFKGMFDHISGKLLDTVAVGSFQEFLEKYGLWAFECIVEYLEKQYTELINNYSEFENNPDFVDNYEPMNEDFDLLEIAKEKDVWLCIADKIIEQAFGGCLGILYKFAKGEASWWDLLECGVCIVWLIVPIPGVGSGAQVCACALERKEDMAKEKGFMAETRFCLSKAFKSSAACTNPYQIILAWLFICGTKFLSLGLALLNFIIFIKNKEILEINTKLMNMRIEAMQENQIAMTTYAERQADFFSDMATGMASSVTFDEMFPPKPEAYISFSDSAGNLINSGDTVCGDEVITISYNFEKFSDIEGFENKIEIFNVDRGVIRPLTSTEDSGEFKYPLDVLFDISPPESSDDGIYEFIFNYGTSQTIYRLDYKEVC